MDDNDDEQLNKSLAGVPIMKFVPIHPRWVVPISYSNGHGLCSLMGWDENSINHEGDGSDETYEGVLVYDADQIYSRTSENVLGTISQRDLWHVRQCILRYGISYPPGTEERHKLKLKKPVVTLSDRQPSHGRGKASDTFAIDSELVE